MGSPREPRSAFPEILKPDHFLADSLSDEGVGNVPDYFVKNEDHVMEGISALIVDDSSVMRKIVERSLRQAGIELSKVFEAGNGAEGLAVLAENTVGLILCDINMPVMDGLEFIKALSGVENAKGAPVVMITTEGSEAHVVQALSLGHGATSANHLLQIRSRSTSCLCWR